MGDPVNPTLDERAETRAVAHRIVQSVVDDELMPFLPPGLTPSQRTEIETLVFRLAQEIVITIDGTPIL